MNYNYRYNIKCDNCGRFINTSELTKGGGGSMCFVPDSDRSTEEIRHRCKKCTEKYGKVLSYQSVVEDLTSWIY